MAKTKRTKSGDGSGQEVQQGSSNETPVISLRMDASSQEVPRELPTAGQEGGGFMTPCSLTGLGAGMSGGALGWVFGFGGYWVRNMRGGQFKASLAEGWGSAKTFGIMGGLYAAVSCFMTRLRQKTDAWNGAASGCATGLALGWKQGPLSALQSCAMLGFFSYFVDSMGATPAAAAVVGTAAPAGCSSPAAGDGGSGGGGMWWQQQQQQQRLLGNPVQLLLSPAMPLLHAVAPCAFGACAVAGGSEAGSSFPGCPVHRR